MSFRNCFQKTSLVMLKVYIARPIIYLLAPVFGNFNDCQRPIHIINFSSIGMN